MPSTTIKDRKNRSALHINRKGKVALSRFPDWSEKEKNEIADMYCALVSNSCREDVMEFLNYEEETEKFCS